MGLSVDAETATGTESLRATFKPAYIRFFAGMYVHVVAVVLSKREFFAAELTLEFEFIFMCQHVAVETRTGLEGTLADRAVFKST